MAKHWCEWKDWRFWGKNRVVPYVWVQRTGVCRVCGNKLHGHWLFNRQKAAVGFY